MNGEHSEMIEAQISRCIGIAEQWGSDPTASSDIIMQTFMEIRAETPNLPLVQRREIVRDRHLIAGRSAPDKPQKYKGLTGKHVLRSRRDHFLHTLGTLAMQAAKSAR